MADPYTTPVPGATGYEAASLAATTAYEKALARLNQERQDTLRQYGYGGSIDPATGVVTNVHVDANLPYGAYQTARQTHADAYEAARQSAQDRGIHGGLANQGLTRLRRGFGAEDAQMGTALTGALGGFQDQQNTAAYARDSALADAQIQAARDAIQQQMFNQANLDGLDTPSGPDWQSIIDQLLGGGDGGGGGDTPAPNSPDSPAAMNQLLNGPRDNRVSPSGYSTATPSRPKAPPAPSRFYTYKKDVPLKKGQTVHFQTGKGYYAA